MSYFSYGWLEVICGPMFSGKTEELIRLVRRAQIARQKVQIFKPMVDTRYHETQVVSHNSLSLEALPVARSKEILEKLNDETRVVAIDEVQFFDNDIVYVVKKLIKRGCRVICGGLDLDYKEIPFGSMPELLCLADQVQKIKAICTVCGMEASKTYRKSNKGDQFLLGSNDLYEARCRAHYEYHEEDEPELPPTEMQVGQENNERNTAASIN